MRLEKHIETEHKEHKQEDATKDRQCRTGTAFAQESEEEIDLHDNLSKVISSSEFKCEMCRIYFKEMNDLEDHLNEIHLAELECVFCKMEFKCINDMDNHMDLEHKGMWKLNDPDILRDGDSEEEFEDEEIEK